MPVPAISTQRTYLTEFMDRCVKAEIEFLSAVTGGQFDSYPFFLKNQGSGPYCIHRLGQAIPEDIADDLQFIPYEIVGRFVCGNVEAGTDGQFETWAYVFEPYIRQLYTENVYLISGEPGNTPDYSDAMLEMSPKGVTYTRTTGTQYFDNKGRKNVPPQIGFQFTVQADFMLQVVRKYAYSPTS